jgi:hypothetical protein
MNHFSENLMISQTSTSLLQTWFSRVGSRRHRASVRPFAALGCLVSQPAIHGLVPLEKVVLVVLHDEPRPNGQIALRLSGYRGTRLPWGVAWGGHYGSVLYKDLRLTPRLDATGVRLDPANEGLLRLALNLENRLHAAHCHGAPTKTEFRLPRLWAGFRPADAATITGQGPELDTASQHRRVAPQTLFRRLTRAHGDYVLYPADWVSHESKRVQAVFADIGGFPARQTISITDLAVDLVGYAGAVQYDLYDSRFRERWRQDAHRDHAAKTALAALADPADLAALADLSDLPAPTVQATLATRTSLMTAAFLPTGVAEGSDDAAVVVPATTPAASFAVAGRETVAVG